jgi:hypothetical protein
VVDLGEASTTLRDAAIALVKDDRGVRVEDYVASVAAAAGEAALASAGFDVAGHDLTPGSPLFYEPVNEVLTGDTLEDVPLGSVYGMLQGLADDAPSPKELYEHVARSVGQAHWGTVTLTVHPDNQPWILPLRSAFALRPTVIDLEAHHGLLVTDRASLVTTALRASIEQVAGAIDRSVAVRLALEVTFGMAKTAPMTQAAVDAVGGEPAPAG